MTNIYTETDMQQYENPSPRRGWPVIGMIATGLVAAAAGFSAGLFAPVPGEAEATTPEACETAIYLAEDSLELMGDISGYTADALELYMNGDYAAMGDKNDLIDDNIQEIRDLTPAYHDAVGECLDE